MTRRLVVGLLLALTACGGSLRQMKKGMEADFARATYEDLQAAGALHDDPVLNGVVRTIGKRLEGPARAKRRVDYSWHVLEWEIPNAFNAGDGYTFLTTGLLRWAESSDELAMVMGHEAAHTADGHITEAIGDMMAENLFIGVIAVAVGGKAANFAQILSSLRSLSYGREHEYVSDRMGVGFAWAGGYNPHYAATFFQRLRDWEPEGEPSDFEIAFMSHPPTQDRIRRLQAQAQAEILGVPAAAAAMANALLDRGFPGEAIPFAQAGRDADGGAALRRAQDHLEGRAEPEPLAALDASASPPKRGDERPEMPVGEVAEEYRGVLWGVISAAERHLDAFGARETATLGDLSCLGRHRGRLTKEALRWPLVEAWLGEAEEAEEWPLDEEERVAALEAGIADLLACSESLLVGGGEGIYERLEARSAGSGRRVLRHLFGTEGPVPHDRGVREAYGEAARLGTDPGATWIVFHLVYNDLLRAWEGPLAFLVPASPLDESGS